MSKFSHSLLAAVFAALLILLSLASPVAAQESNRVRVETVMSSQTINRGTSTCTSTRRCTDSDWIDVQDVDAVGVVVRATSTAGTSNVKVLLLVSLDGDTSTEVSGPTLTSSTTAEAWEAYEGLVPNLYAKIKLRVIGNSADARDTTVDAQVSLIPRAR